MQNGQNQLKELRSKITELNQILILTITNQLLKSKL